MRGADHLQVWVMFVRPGVVVILLIGGTQRIDAFPPSAVVIIRIKEAGGKGLAESRHQPQINTMYSGETSIGSILCFRRSTRP